MFAIYYLYHFPLSATTSISCPHSKEAATVTILWSAYFIIYYVGLNDSTIKEKLLMRAMLIA